MDDRSACCGGCFGSPRRRFLGAGGLKRVLHRCANVPVRFLVWRLRIWGGVGGPEVGGAGGGQGILWLRRLMRVGRCGVGKVSVALVALTVELLVLAWL